jgi:hypothetical protein
MKKTKIISIIISIGLLLSASKCTIYENFDTIPICIDNLSEFTIARYIPWQVIMDEGVVYPDTTLSIAKERIGCCIHPHETRCFDQLNTTYEHWLSSFPKDTVSIYIFNQDTLDAYPWEIIQRDYKILQRYDLSLEDIYVLKENNIPVIPYPPNEKMKNMKMYPPYE